MAHTIAYLSIILVAIIVLIAYIICRRKGKNCLEQQQAKGTTITLAYKDE